MKDKTYHLLIVDALNLIRRIHAVQGSPCRQPCLHTLQQLLLHLQPTHVVAVFDNHQHSTGWRHRLLPAYKARRIAMPDELQNELPVLKQAFSAIGVRCWTTATDEADDLAATLAIKVAASGHRATIVSTDKGYCQLLAPSIFIRDYFQKRWLDLPFVTREFTVAPHQLIDYWGLTGITGSNIPGVTGIGPKRACQLLTTFGTLANLYRHLSAVPEKWRHHLESQREIAFICRQVASLKTDLVINRNLTELRFQLKPFTCD